MKLKFKLVTKLYPQKPESMPENETYKIFWDFQIQKRHIIPDRRSDFVLKLTMKKKLSSCRFWRSVRSQSRYKGRHINTYLEVAIELKKLCSMRVTVILVLVDALGTVPQGLVRGLDERWIRRKIETIQTTALVRSVKILRRVLETWGDLLLPRIQWKIISWRWCEIFRSQKANISECWKLTKIQE